MNRRFPRPPTLLAAIAMLAAVSNCKKDNAPEPVAAEPSLPGAQPFTVKLVASLETALKNKVQGYVPRTKHKAADGSPLYTNRLIKESSPYLLQHAHNPVNWYPWGDEAFAEAKRLGRPVFLSIGYSTCHWCHVMEEESFEDVEIATYLNANYIAIKVDREERPDVDSIYMAALAAMGQKGGWPLNMWLTPERLPFFGGTYFPPRKGVRRAKIGFDEILARAKEQFDENRELVASEARKLAEAIKRSNEPKEATSSFVGAEVLARAGTGYMAKIDRGFGGLLGERSKFPSSFPVRFMLRYATTLSDLQARADAHGAIRLTLDSMRAGGIYDQVGGGFHRYSVDQRWVVPHFEKMLYDNALLAVTYLEAFVALGEVNDAGTATDILAYLVREMRSDEGGFYSATDADSMTSEGHREEGAFFVWTPAEIAAALSVEDATLATEVWGVSPRGNFEGNNILLVGDKVADRDPRVLPIRDKLMAVRSNRPPPLRDDKVLAAWNGLALSALARAAAVLPSDFAPPPPARGKGLDYATLARETATFLVTKMVVDGRLRRAYKDGRAYGDAYAEDYAFVIAGLLELFEATGESRWLGEALALQKTLDKNYRAKSGAYFRTANDAEALLAREVPARDGAIPSANSVAALNLRRLYELTSDAKTLEAADALLDSFGDQLRRAPSSLSEMLLAVDFRVAVAKEIVLAGTEGAGFGPLESVLRSSYIPRAVVVRKASSAPKDLAKLVPLSAGKTAIGGRPTAFVCEQTRCELPTSDPAAFAKQLAKTR